MTLLMIPTAILMSYDDDMLSVYKCVQILFIIQVVLMIWNDIWWYDIVLWSIDVMMIYIMMMIVPVLIWFYCIHYMKVLYWYDWYKWW